MTDVATHKWTLGHSAGWSAAAALVRASWEHNRAWALVVLAYMAFAEVFTRALGYEQLDWGYFDDLVGPSLWALILPGLVLLSWRLLRDRPARPWAFARALLFERWRCAERVAAALPVLVATPLFLAAFTSVKLGIPEIVPFHLDPALARLDEVLHGGDPWRLLQPVLGDPLVTRLVDAVYAAWFAVFYVAVTVCAAWIDRPELRARFLLAFFLCWILLGTVAAYALSSVGPCFYELAYGDGRFAEKMALLQQAGEAHFLPALHLQDALWRAVSTGDRSFPFGVSAAPSMHVAIAMLLAVMAWRLGRWPAATGVAFLVVIGLGSVHLAWHYAVDGYFSVAGVLLVWWLSGRLLRSAALAPPGFASLRAPRP